MHAKEAASLVFDGFGQPPPLPALRIFLLITFHFIVCWDRFDAARQCHLFWYAFQQNNSSS